MRWAWSFLRPFRRPFAVLVALSSVEIVLRILAPWALAIVIDHALNPAPVRGWLAEVLPALGLSTERRDLLILFAGIGLGLQLIHQLVVMFHGRVSVAISQGMIHELREELFAHVQALTLEHHTATPTGDVVQRLEGDTRCVDQLVLRATLPFAFSLITLLVMFIGLALIDLPLALLSLAVIPPLYIWLKYYSGRMATPTDAARRSDSRLSSRLYESITSIRLIKSHAREAHEQARFSRVAGDAAHAWIRVGHQGTVFAIVSGALTVIGSSLILLVGGMRVLDGTMTIGTLLLVMTYLGYVYGPLQAIASTANTMQQALGSARRVRHVLDITPEVASGEIDADQIRGEVQLEDVSFHYCEGTAALDHVTLTARPGEVIALVGPSGAGKSTLASLLVRFYDPTAGQIRIDGVPVDQYRLHSLRQRVAIVLQESLVMSGTVRENLC
ncbi:MAG: ABC transporter ATP-binding protein, partial [Deltaproteobacteria bacterium]|nr:ABC transporter ATP-binding protein [Deltaproteobacteria bacterium]